MQCAGPRRADCLVVDDSPVVRDHSLSRCAPAGQGLEMAMAKGSSG